MKRSQFISELTQLLVMCKASDLGYENTAREIAAFVDYRGLLGPEAWLDYKSDRVTEKPPNDDMEFIDGEYVNRWEDETT